MNFKSAILWVVFMTMFAGAAEVAKGSFEVKLKPVESAAVGRMTLDKTFAGDLAGTSQGEMLGHMSAVKGSGGYGAMEKVTATLAGRKGTFVLQHMGTMAGGKQDLRITVVPDSATDALAGLAGSMDIRIDGKDHFYTFTYTLPAQ
jgi:hypothetical protein